MTDTIIKEGREVIPSRISAVTERGSWRPLSGDPIGEFEMREIAKTLSNWIEKIDELAGMTATDRRHDEEWLRFERSRERMVTDQSF